MLDSAKKVPDLPGDRTAAGRLLRDSIRADPVAVVLEQQHPLLCDNLFDNFDQRANRTYRIGYSVAIEGLTYYERDFTRTNREISYALKSIIAQLMNSILVPVIANLYIRRNIYLANGLVY